ncbi:MAG: quinol dehydrogenase ferredoxin subunit NapH [Magnetospirillum sp. WYHS-4]
MSKGTLYTPGAEAVAVKGRFAAYRWLILRRVSQVGILVLFMVGPVLLWLKGAGGRPAEVFWPVKGTLASSLTLDVLPLTDPFMVLQSLAAGHVMTKTAFIGAAIVLAFYLLVGGRTYCSWVCPVNIVTDAAHWLRQKLGLKGGIQLARRTRYWVMAMALIVSAATGVLAWELVNPITIFQRVLTFGVGLGWLVILGIFLYDTFASKRGWCSHLCPVGAFYALVNRFGLVKVSAAKRSACTNCMDCFAVCPEPHVITPALRGADRGLGPVILSADCTNCGRCADVCAPAVFEFATRFANQSEAKPGEHASSQVPKAA